MDNFHEENETDFWTFYPIAIIIILAVWSVFCWAAYILI